MKDFVPGIWIVDLSDKMEYFILSYDRLNDENFELSRDGIHLSTTCYIDSLNRWFEVSSRPVLNFEKEAAAKLM